MASEASKLTKQVRDILTLSGWFVWRGGFAVVGGGRIGEKGAPDLNAVKAGRYLGVEIKAQSTKDRMRPEQIGFHEMLRLKGCTVLVVRTLKDIQEFLDR